MSIFFFAIGNLISSPEITFLFKKNKRVGQKLLLSTLSQHLHKILMRVFPNLFQKLAVSV